MEESLSSLEAKLDALLELLRNEFASRKREHWLDLETAKYLLRVSERTLNTYVRTKGLVVKKMGRSNVYLESSVMQFVNRL